jgi:cytochrome c
MQTMLQIKEQIPEEYRIMDRTPVSPTSQSLGRGQELYARDCAVCHGQGGKGDRWHLVNHILNLQKSTGKKK